VDIKKCLVIAAMCVLLGATALAQDANQAAPEMSSAQKSSLIKEFSRTAKVDGVLLNFVLLNNKMIDALFSGDSRYSMRARANASTTFYVWGTPDTDISLKPRFVVEQNGKKFTGEVINIKNFEVGTVTRGTRISGLIQLSEKINVTQSFKIKGAFDGAAEFKLSAAAIKHLEN
jgi:hypothetical protein